VRSDQRGEAIGLDITQHGEEAYTRGEGAVLVMSSVAGAAARSSDDAVRLRVEVPA
jgi:Amt family ammonium transporter